MDIGLVSPRELENKAIQIVGWVSLDNVSNPILSGFLIFFQVHSDTSIHHGGIIEFLLPSGDELISKLLSRFSVFTIQTLQNLPLLFVALLLGVSYGFLNFLLMLIVEIILLFSMLVDYVLDTCLVTL